MYRLWLLAAVFIAMLQTETLLAAGHEDECEIPILCNKKIIKTIIQLEIERRKNKVVQKPKQKKIVKPKVLVKPKPVVPPKRPIVVTKKPEPVLRKAKPSGPPPSWLGLEYVAPIRLEFEDYRDITGQYIIELLPDAFIAQGLDLQTTSRAELAVLLGITTPQVRSVQRRFLKSAVIWGTPAQIAALRTNPLVGFIEADSAIKAAGKALPLSWGLDRLDSPSLPLDGRFDREHGDYEARIYLFDTGVDSPHAEFGSRVKFGASFVMQQPNIAQTCREHGTEMASMIAGATTGVAPKAEIIELVVLPCKRNQTGYASSIIEAAHWLLSREADYGDGKPAIANMSLTGRWSKHVNDAVEDLTANGVVVVAAAGNEGKDAKRFSPASAPSAITVAATGPDDSTPEFSNDGKAIDIHAPGKFVTAMTEDLAGKYVVVDGTSGAAALVSGLLARSLSKKGTISAAKWLAHVGSPSKVWRKNQKQALLAQTGAGWRNVCRLFAETKIFARPVTAAKTIGKISAEVLVKIDARTGDWVKMRDLNGKDGWLLNAPSASPNLLEPAEDKPCVLRD